MGRPRQRKWRRNRSLFRQNQQDIDDRNVLVRVARSWSPLSDSSDRFGDKLCLISAIFVPSLPHSESKSRDPAQFSKSRFRFLVAVSSKKKSVIRYEYRHRLAIRETLGFYLPIHPPPISFAL